VDARRSIALCCCAIAAVAAFASADAAADTHEVVHPTAPRVFRIPTAFLQPAGRGHGTAGLDHRGAGYLALTYGLGGLADVELEVDDRFVTAAFKMGIAQGELSRWLPAAAIAFRKSVAGQDRELAHLQLATSYALGMFELHGGATVWTNPTAARGFAGLEWHPPIYPRTTLLAEIDYERTDTDADAPAPVPTWRAHWGIRYQALSWGSIELGVRHREAEEIGRSTVMVRVNGVVR